MKKNTDHSQKAKRISMRGHLPLLRGMFVVPESAGRKLRAVGADTNYPVNSDNELVLTPQMGCYLGE